ncbi:hypothetical protein J6590_072082 [Homalodisca vitripennis]|nr:hypothetical protein J6590_072082 [Homalodisca vitripennis]
MKVVYSLKAQNSEWYAHRRDPAVHDVILKKGVHLMLDNRDQLGRRIYLLRLGRLVPLRGMEERPDRSPDLSMCYLFLWECLKDKVLKHSLHRLSELRERIIEHSVTSRHV